MQLLTVWLCSGVWLNATADCLTVLGLAPARRFVDRNLDPFCVTFVRMHAPQAGSSDVVTEYFREAIQASTPENRGEITVLLTAAMEG